MTGGLRRVVTSHVLVAAAVLVLGAGIAAGAFVGFSAETQTKTSTFAGGWLDAPTGLQAPVVSGYGATLTWTPGTHDLTGQALFETDQGTTTNCTGATYATQVATGLTTSLTTTTDAGLASSNGHWMCYQIRSTRGSWYAGANFAALQIGLVPTGVAVTNSGNAGQINSGDTITLSFNQNIAYSGAASISVCAFVSPANVILIGDTGCASSSDTPTIGKITGVSIPNASRTYTTVAVSATNNQLSIVLGGGGNGANDRTTVTGTGTFAFTGSGTVIQSTAGAASVCTVNCPWAWSGAF
jgi:hypothetical protein